MALGGVNLDSIGNGLSYVCRSVKNAVKNPGKVLMGLAAVGGLSSYYASIGDPIDKLVFPFPNTLQECPDLTLNSFLKIFNTGHPTINFVTVQNFPCGEDADLIIYGENHADIASRTAFLLSIVHQRTNAGASLENELEFYIEGQKEAKLKMPVKELLLTTKELPVGKQPLLFTRLETDSFREITNDKVSKIKTFFAKLNNVYHEDFLEWSDLYEFEDMSVRLEYLKDGILDKTHPYVGNINNVLNDIDDFVYGTMVSRTMDWNEKIITASQSSADPITVICGLNHVVGKSGRILTRGLLDKKISIVLDTKRLKESIFFEIESKKAYNDQWELYVENFGEPKTSN